MSRIHPKIEAAADTLGLPDVTRRRLLSGAGLASASLAATALLSACGRDAAEQGVVGNYPETPRWRFTFVNHVTAHPFFTPTQYGLEDAAAILNVQTQWTGSADAIVAEMVDATNAAISGQVDGIALSVTDASAFTAPVDQALAAGIPMVSYNADGEPDNPGTNRLAYIGQPLYDSGRQLGQRLLDSGFAGGTTIMFAAVAAAVIGGTALAGGSGTVLGAAVGAVVLAVLRNGFTLIGINADRFFLVLGIAILTAMVLNVYLARARTSGRLT